MKRILAFCLISIFSSNLSGAEAQQASKKYNQAIIKLIMSDDPHSVDFFRNFIAQHADEIDWNATLQEKTNQNPSEFPVEGLFTAQAPLAYAAKIGKPGIIIELLTNNKTKNKIDINVKGAHPNLFEVSKYIEWFHELPASELESLGLKPEDEKLFREAFVMLLEHNADVDEKLGPGDAEEPIEEQDLTFLQLMQTQLPKVWQIYQEWKKQKES